MIVKKEKITSKIKNYFKNIFSKILNNSKKKKANVHKHEPIKSIIPNKEKMESVINEPLKRDNREITIEYIGKKKKPKEITIEYEARNNKKRKPIVVEYEQRNKKRPPAKIEDKKNKQVIEIEVKQNKKPVETKKEQHKTQPYNGQQKMIYKNSNNQRVVKRKTATRPEQVTETKKVVYEKEELALRPVKQKKEKKPFNIFQIFKDKERKKRKEILNKLKENKMDDYETISTKTKLSKGSIAVEDVDANELDPLIDLYRDSNNKLRNRIIESQQ